MVDADEIADMSNGPRHIPGSRRADRSLPVANTDHAAGLGDALDLVVGQIAIDLARGLHAAVTGDDRTRSHREHFGHGGVTGMGEVNDHPQGFHALNNLTTEGGEPALAN